MIKKLALGLFLCFIPLHICFALLQLVPVYEDIGIGGEILSEVGFETSGGFPDASSGNVDIYDQPGNETQGWVSSYDNAFWISDDQKHAGSQALYVDTGVSAGATDAVTKAFTEQTGTFWLDFWIAGTNVSGNDTARVGCSDAPWGTTTTAFVMRIYQQDLQTYTSASWTNCWENGITVNNQFYHVQVELNLSSDTYDVWVDNTLRCSSVAFYNSEDALDVIYSSDFGQAGQDIYIDDVEVYTGSRKGS